MKEFLGNRVPIKSWAGDLEEPEMTQVTMVANLPFTFKHVSVMPDVHLGMGCVIGGVVACEGVVVPSFVGSDAGCGMSAIKTDLKLSDFTQEKRDQWLHSICRSIPMGISHNSDKKRDFLKSNYCCKFKKMHTEIANTKYNPFSADTYQELENKFFSSLNSLGGGNHFLELQYDKYENIWIMIHSGSRNFGKTICDYFNNVATEINKKYYSSVDPSIAFLHTNTQEGKDYIAWMNFALEFAKFNRYLMMQDIMKDTKHLFNNDVLFGNILDVHHNYASLENHYGKNVWVHRKGATSAKEGQLGIIPGSMGTASYIVKGLGKRESFNSCSHGAGRVMSRTKFNIENNTPDKMAELEKSLDGITHSSFKKVKRNKKLEGMLDVSESPAAYKDIDVVMANQSDLVTIDVKLKPLVVAKG